MPRPSKFSRKRQELLVAVLSAGASRRTAAEIAGVHPRTLGRWIERGRTGAVGGRWQEFSAAVAAAEAAQPKPALLPLPPEPSSAELRIAERLIFGSEWAPTEVHAEWPLVVSVVYSTGSPSRGAARSSRERRSGRTRHDLRPRR